MIKAKEKNGANGEGHVGRRVGREEHEGATEHLFFKGSLTPAPRVSSKPKKSVTYMMTSPMRIAVCSSASTSAGSADFAAHAMSRAKKVAAASGGTATAPERKRVT